MPVSLAAVGDIVLEGPPKNLFGNGTVHDQLRSADFGFANLEMPFTSSEQPAEKLIALKCDPVHAIILPAIGIDTVTVANNHGMDYGAEGLRDTLRALNAVGVTHVGGGENLSEALPHKTKDSAGVKMAFIGVTSTLPNGSRAGLSRPGLAGVRVFTKYVIDTVTLDESPGMSPFSETTTYKPDEDQVLQAIAKARAEADVVVVGIHWGVPYGWTAFTQKEMAQYQRPLAHAMIDAGASAIVGHHPHVVHGVELHKGSPIFYSLGNFIFSNSIVEPDAEWRTYPAYNWKSLQSRLSSTGALAKISWKDKQLVRCSLVPLSIGTNGEPLHATCEDAELLLARLVELSSDLGTKFQISTLSDGYEITIEAASDLGRWTMHH